MFNLNFKVEFSDILLTLGILTITIGLFFILPAISLVFLGIALIVLAFLTTSKGHEKKKGGD